MIRKKDLDLMMCHALDGYPLEVCGLLIGIPDDPAVATRVTSVEPAENVAASSRIYEIAPKVLLEVERRAEATGTQIVGVYHSHTHTDAKPSPTDIAQAPDPTWHYVLVSLRDEHPCVRSWNIDSGNIEEEEVVVKW